ncbi:hypothetical protein BUMB_02925 [Candidatus Paraburkholderia calva]|nr:hypothetical protein BUMB_02925 [Candidatus Paraburkholderia calva]
MWPRDASELNADLNAIQTMMLSLCDGVYRIEMFQNTPATFHGRPEKSECLSAELRELGRPDAGGRVR